MSKDLIAPRFDAEGWWCEDGHKLPWNHPFCVANSPKGPTHERPDVINLLMMMTEERDRLRRVVEAADRLNDAWCDAINSMDDDNQVEGDEWGAWMKAHRDMNEALDALDALEEIIRAPARADAADGTDGGEGVSVDRIPSRPHFPDTATTDRLQRLGGVLRCEVCLIERGLGDVRTHLGEGWPTHHGRTMKWVTARQLRLEK